jgi:hypothetical protein
MMQKDIILAIILGFALTGCVVMDEGNKEERQALKPLTLLKHTGKADVSQRND